jgi:AcrR family transcriptional regulator
MAGPQDVHAQPRGAQEEQLERTRQRILEALAVELTSGGRDAWSVPSVARRAAVAVRTVYRHFPSREALLAGLEQRTRDLLGPASAPSAASDIAALCRRRFDAFEPQAPLLHAALRVSPALGAPDPRQLEALEAALAPVVAPLKPARRQQAHALMAHLTSPAAWHSLHEQAGPLAGKAAAWAVQSLLRELERRARKAQRGRNERKSHRR